MLGARQRRRHAGKEGQESRAQPTNKFDDAAAWQSDLALERIESQRREEEADRASDQERRERAIAKIRAKIEKATREHETKARSIDAERAALEKRSQVEDERWEEQKEKLERLLRSSTE